MSASALLVWAAALAALAVAARRGRAALFSAAAQTGTSLRTILPTLALALPAAGFLTVLLPDRFAAALFGEETGLAGHLLATLVGAILPGGPFVSFPVALALWQSGAGTAQMVTLMSAWSVLAAHRLVVWEGPLLGWRFAALRLAASLPLPLLSGLAAE
ncbi:MAG: hypothetical protein NZ523_02260, partial [Elioraea sp.]|nr:hypothetical protein [Elioraea sp.]